MVLAALAVAVIAQAPPAESADQIKVMRGAQSWDLSWSDAEDTLHGTVRPLELVEGQSADVSLTVGTFQGPPFDGPVTFSLRCEEWSHELTVRRTSGERAWAASFVPEGAGDCVLDVAFNTLRHKRLHAKLAVAPARLTRTPWYVLIAVTAAALLGYGIRSVLKKPEGA
jgi:hypothetical protein